MIPSALQDGQHGIFPNDTYFAKEERDIIIRVHKEIHDKKIHDTNRIPVSKGVISNI